MRGITIFGLTMAVTVLTWSNAKAVSITDYNSAASLEGALGSYSIEDFSRSTLNPGVSVATVEGQVTGGLWADRLVPNTESTTWAFSSAITAWGADFDFTPGGPGTGINITLDFYGGGSLLAHTILNPSSSEAFVGFYGLISSVPFDRVVLTAGPQSGNAETYNMDNMIYGSVGISSASAIAGGRYHSLALKPDGTIWAWGYNAYGQLGDGTTINRSNAVQVSGLNGVIAVSGGIQDSLALTSDGTVWAWGFNAYGELGNGTNSGYNPNPTPVQVSGLNGVVAIADGGSGLALKSDGTVWAWGYNGSGQLGDGTTTNHYTPVQVSGLNGVIAVSGGDGTSLALKSDGTVWAWGVNDFGQLGDGTEDYNSHPVPVQVSGLDGVVAIDGTFDHSLALKSDGTVWAWGYNGYGQLGDGTIIDRYTPVHVNGLNGVVAVAGGLDYSLALKPDGTVWSWGYNGYGELGDGTTSERNSPVQVQGLNARCMSFTLSVGGDATIPENASKYFSVTAQFQAGSTKDVSQAAVWSIVGNNYGSSFSGNMLTAGTVIQDTPITIRASYSCGGSNVTSPPMTVTIIHTLFVSISSTTGSQNMTPSWPIQLSANVAGSNGTPQYQWSFPGSNQNGDLTAANTWVSYPQYGTYLATVTVQDGNSTATAYSYIVVVYPIGINQPIGPTPPDPVVGNMRDSADPSKAVSFNATWGNRKNNGLIIITHGLLDSATNADWLSAMASAITQRINPNSVPNIVLLDWHTQADPAGYHTGTAQLESSGINPVLWADGSAVIQTSDFVADLERIRPNGVQQGIFLADWIVNNIASQNINPNAPIQIIGHSAGGFVGGECARILPSQISQVTMLDTPVPLRSHIPTPQFVGTVKVERYISSYFGLLSDEFKSTTPAPGDVNPYCFLSDVLCCGLGDTLCSQFLLNISPNGRYYRDPLILVYGDLPPTPSAHSRATDWYTQTINNSGSLDGFYYSPFLGRALPSSSVASPNLMAFASVPSGPTMTNITLAGFSTFGTVILSNGNYQLVEAADAGIFSTITFPAGIESINFGYCFTTPGTGDYLCVTIGTNTVLYSGPDIAITQNTNNYMTAQIDLSRMASQTGQIVLRLVSRGSTNAVLTISNITMTVNLDVNHDSVGDGIADWWRQQFFSGQQYFGGDGTTTNGYSCTTCDVDGTGQNNLFKYVAGLDPTNPASVFAFGIANLPNQPRSMNLNINPFAPGRTYTPQFSTDLVSGVWLPLTGYTGAVTNGSQITISDTNPASPQKFYRIDISLP